MRVSPPPWDVWRRVPVALLLALAAVAAGVCAPAPASAHDWLPGYSAPDDRDPGPAALEMDPGTVPGPSGASSVHHPRPFRGQLTPGVVPGRASLPTRDRSPPAR